MSLEFKKANPKYPDLGVFGMMNDTKSFRYIWKADFRLEADDNPQIVAAEIRARINEYVPRAIVYTRSANDWGQIIVCLKSSKTNAQFIFYTSAGKFDI